MIILFFENRAPGY